MSLIFLVGETTSVSGFANRCVTSAVASSFVSPPTRSFPIVTPGAITFGNGGVVVGGGSVVVGGVVSVAVVPVVVPSSAAADGACTTASANATPATPQTTSRNAETPRFTTEV